MNSTLDLLDKARAAAKPQSERQLSIALGHAPTTLAMARTRGSLSPTLAGQLAELAGEDPTPWVALAALEAAPRSRVTDHLKRLIASGRRSSKVWLSRMAKRNRRPAGHAFGT